MGRKVEKKRELERKIFLLQNLTAQSSNALRLQIKVILIKSLNLEIQVGALYRYIHINILHV